MEKVLLLFSNAMDCGGAETFMMKIYRGIDKGRYQFDFCVSDSKKGFYDDEIKSYGGRIHYVTGKSENLVLHFKELYRLLKRENYTAVCNVSSNSATTIDLVIARLAGVKKLVMRATNSDIKDKKLKKIDAALKFLNIFVPNIKLAPSTEAAIFTFGKGVVNKKNFTVLHNAIDLDVYKYDEAVRSKVRKDLKLENKKIIGHVGRFSQQKNHSFLIDVFSEISKKDENAHLVLVGTGELMEDIMAKVRCCNISDRVTFLGARNDVPGLLNAFDVLLFPSLYEGMPNVVIEAQATGLSCVISDSITKEANITGLVSYLPLSEGAYKWGEEVLKKAENTVRSGQRASFIKNGYDIESSVAVFEKIVFAE